MKIGAETYADRVRKGQTKNGKYFWNVFIIT